MRLLLEEVEVEHLRVLRGPLRVGFKPGVNVIHGPNETGKSTLMEAIWAALALKARSAAAAQKALASLSGGTPRVGLTFSLDGEAWRVDKTFGPRGEARVERRAPGQPAELLEGEAAEERLREALGLGLPGRDGHLKEDQLGAWALLRVPQGQAVTAPHQQMGEGARVALGESLAALGGGILATEGADLLLKRAEAEFLRHFTGTGKASTRADAPAHQARQRLDAAEAEEAALARQVDAREEDLDDHARRQARLDALDRQLPGLREAKDEAARRRQALDALRRQQQDAELEVERARRALDDVDRRLERRRGLREREKAAEARLAVAEAARARAARDREAHARAGPPLRQALDAARARREAAEALPVALRAWLEVLSAREEQARLDRDLADAREAEEAQRVAVAELSLRRVTDDAALARLEDLHEAAREARARLDAGAATLRLRALRALELVEPEGARRLEPDEVHRVDAVDRRVVRLPGLVELDLSPGGEDHAARQRAVREATEALARALAALELPDLAAARRDRALTRQLREDVEGRKRARAGRPGVAELELQRTRASSREEDARRRLRGVGPDLPREPADARAALEPAEATAREARAAADAATRALHEHDLEANTLREREGAADQELARARAELEGLHAELAAGREQQGDDDALVLERARCGQLVAEAEARRAEVLARLAACEPRQVEQDEQRAREALEGAERERAELRSQLDQLKGRLEAEAGVGLHDRRARARAEAEAARDELARAEAEAEAAQRLFTVLKHSRDEAWQGTLSPLREEVSRLLGRLFPRAAVHFDEQFALTQLDRGQDHALGFEALSQGAREQLGVLVRLAMARLLAGEGGCLPLLLDDPFTNTDPDRLVRMAAVLNDAGEQLQLIVLTWDWDRLRGAGLLAHQRVDLADLKRGGA